MTNKSVPQECPEDCPTRMSDKSPTRASVIQGVPQECPTKVSEKNVSYKSVKKLAFGFVGSILFLKTNMTGLWNNQAKIERNLMFVGWGRPTQQKHEKIKQRRKVWFTLIFSGLASPTGSWEAVRVDP